MSIFLWIIFGALAGWIASWFLKTEYKHGVLSDIILGIAGAIVGGLLMNFFGQPGVTGFNIYSLIVAIVGGLVLIWLGRILYR